MRRRGSRSESHGEGGSSERWLVSYADLITLLFAFFVVMYATSQADLKRFREVSEGMQRAFSGPGSGSAPGPRPEPTPSASASEGAGAGAAPSAAESVQDRSSELEQIKRLIEGELDLAGDLAPRSHKKSVLQAEAPQLRWVIQENYAIGEASVGQDYLPFLSRVARVLERFPRREIRLEGHADVHEQGHRKIGFQRASWLADFMADQGMPITRLTVASRGAERPLRPEGSYWARAANRRVELVVE